MRQTHPVSHSQHLLLSKVCSKIKGTFDLRVNHLHHHIPLIQHKQQLIDLILKQRTNRYLEKDLFCVNCTYFVCCNYLSLPQNVPQGVKAAGQISLPISIVHKRYFAFLFHSFILYLAALKGETWWMCKRNNFFRDLFRVYHNAVLRTKWSNVVRTIGLFLDIYCMH